MNRSNIISARKTGTHVLRCAASVAVLSLLAACGGGNSNGASSSTQADTNLAKAYAATSAKAAAAATTVWQPTLADSFNLQLTGTVSSTVATTIYDIDLFDNSASKIAQIKAAGHRVICYFSAGSSEDWRSDYAKFKSTDKGKALDGWEGENWLDTRSANVRAIMLSRMDLAVTKGCDGVDPDNVDGYTNSTGFPLTAATQIDYNTYLASAAHARGLAVALKNDVDQLGSLAPVFDLAVNEQCHEYSECGGYSAFTNLGKPVLNVEYKKSYKNNTNSAFDKLCTSANAAKLYTEVLPLALDGSFRKSCK